MRVELLDPPAYSPPYDDALARALVRAGASVRLVTSRFAHGTAPTPSGYLVEHRFYRRARGAPGTRGRQLSKAVAHIPEFLNWRRGLRARADVVHLQWLTLPELDLRLLPRSVPTVLTIHDPLVRADSRRLGARLGPRAFDRVDAVIVHSQFAQQAVFEAYGLGPEKVSVIRHGAITPARAPGRLPAELSGIGDGVPVVLCFGLLRPYKGIDSLLAVWRRPEFEGSQLWIVGRPMMELQQLRAAAPANVRFVPRFVSAAEEAAVFARADVVALPYERSERFGFSGVLATAMGAGKAIVASDVGGFSEVGALGAAAIVPVGDLEALTATLSRLISDPAQRMLLERAATSAARDEFSWDVAARATLALYEEIGA